jgi:lipopolysaccharide export system protein LptA
VQAKFRHDTGKAFCTGWMLEKNSPVIAPDGLRAGRRPALSAAAIAMGISAAAVIASIAVWVPAMAQEAAASPVIAATSSANAAASPAAQPSPKAAGAAGDSPGAAGAAKPVGAPGASARRARRGGKSAGAGDTASKGAQGDENATPFGAFGGSNRGPVNIQSDSLSLDYKNTTTTFNGNVHATQADGVLISDKLIVKHGKDFNDVQRMFAEGNVRISQGLRWCTSDHAVLDQKAHTVVLTGSPVCHDAGDQIAGNKITVHLDSGKSDVEGVKAVIFPRQSKTRDNEASADNVK